MPTVKVPLSSSVYTNADGIELTDNDSQLLNGYISEMGYTVKRPGLELALDLGEGVNKPVQGMYWWAEKQAGLAVCNGKVFRLAYSAGTLSATNITTNTLSGSGRPTFALGNDANVVTPTLYGVIANGGAMIFGKGTGTSISNFATIADVDAPTTVTHVDAIDGYLLANTTRNVFQFSDLTDPESWAAVSYASAMRNPDSVKALKVFNRQIFLFGTETLERWENDGTSPFSPAPGGFYETGIIAPDSVVRTEMGLYWLSSTRRLVRYSAENGIIRVSTPYDREISSFTDLTDAYSIYLEINGQPFILVTFEADNRTLAYNMIQDKWSEWTWWDSSSSQDSRFLASSFMYSPLWGVNLIGSRFDSKIYYLSSSYKTDAGNEIRLKKVTGHIDYGTTKRKRSNELRIRLKRGEGTGSGEGKLLVRWNDDRRGWSNQHEISLGDVGEYEIVRRIFPRGAYRTRQYEFLVTDPVSVVLGGAEEDIDILGN